MHRTNWMSTWALGSHVPRVVSNDQGGRVRAALTYGGTCGATVGATSWVGLPRFRHVGAPVAQLMAQPHSSRRMVTRRMVMSILTHAHCKCLVFGAHACKH